MAALSVSLKRAAHESRRYGSANLLRRPVDQAANPGVPCAFMVLAALV